ncbi:MAG: hypothetical protein IPH52_04200 [Leptospiraceae bacterium]|nr:hypothetical protein [Leptospiraceae bacterium]
MGIDFSFPDPVKIFEALTLRIYFTRCAISHFNEENPHAIPDPGDIYVPYYSNTRLIKETLLLRFIAEEIIESKSTAF